MLYSIITVTYNNLGGLQRTADSLRAQSFQGFEWLVIDGGSDDGSIAYLEDINAPYISEPDDGIYDAMNKGIERAEGFYVLFLNAGDVLASDTTFSELAGYIEELQSTPDFIYGDSLEEIPGKEPAYKPSRAYKSAAYGMFTHHQAMFYRRETIDDLRYDTAYKIAADYKFTLQFLDKGGNVVYFPKALCLFESGGISQQNAALGRDEQFRIRRDLGTVRPWKNCMIMAKQRIIWTLRRIFPKLYWLIKAKT